MGLGRRVEGPGGCSRGPVVYRSDDWKLTLDPCLRSSNRVLVHLLKPYRGYKGILHSPNQQEESSLM